MEKGSEETKDGPLAPEDVERSGPRPATEEELELFCRPAPVVYETEDIKFIKSTGLLSTDPELSGFEIKESGMMVQWAMDPATGKPKLDQEGKKILSFMGVASRMMIDLAYSNQFLCVRDAKTRAEWTDNHVIVLDSDGFYSDDVKEGTAPEKDILIGDCTASMAGAATSATPDSIIMPCSRLPVYFEYPTGTPVMVTLKARDPLRGFTGKELKETIEGYYNMFMILGTGWDLMRSQFCAGTRGPHSTEPQLTKAQSMGQQSTDQSERPATARPLFPFGGAAWDGNGNSIEYLRYSSEKKAWETVRASWA